MFPVLFPPPIFINSLSWIILCENVIEIFSQMQKIMVKYFVEINLNQLS